jgi:hypothetical protein
MELSDIAQGIVAIVVLYVSYRTLQSEVRITDKITAVINEKCADKKDFQAHIKADEVFQAALLRDITEKREEYARDHANHYRHSDTTVIHQPSMASDLITEKFENVKAQVGEVRQRVESLSKLIETRMR